MSSVRRIVSRTLGITLLAVGMTALLPAAVFAETSLSLTERPDGSLWLIGCAENDVAERMLAHDAFQSSGPVSILCVVGTTAVFKQLR